jgi:hypothetical protein
MVRALAGNGRGASLLIFMLKKLRRIALRILRGVPREDHDQQREKWMRLNDRRLLRICELADELETLHTVVNSQALTNLRTFKGTSDLPKDYPLDPASLALPEGARQPMIPTPPLTDKEQEHIAWVRRVLR